LYRDGKHPATEEEVLWVTPKFTSTWINRGLVHADIVVSGSNRTLIITTDSHPHTLSFGTIEYTGLFHYASVVQMLKKLDDSQIKVYVLSEFGLSSPPVLLHCKLEGIKIHIVSLLLSVASVQLVRVSMVRGGKLLSIRKQGVGPKVHYVYAADTTSWVQWDR